MTSAAEDELTHREELAAVLQRRLRVLEIQRARLGDLVPASIVLELEDTEQQLAQVQAYLRRLRPSPTDIHNPYLGLLTFQEDDSSFFFGRDVLIGELLRKAEQTTFLAILGPSGGGKSSVVRAGLIPALKRGALPGSDRWYYLPPLKPGPRSLDTLATSLAAEQAGRLGEILSIREALRKSNDALLLAAGGLRAGDTDARFVLVVDQAEELWTLAPTEPAARGTFLTEQQQPFIQALLAAAGAPDQSVLIILTMRADFLHRALEHPDLAPWIREHTVMLQPQSRDELHSAIARPAKLVGGRFEPGLIDTLVEQTIAQPGALPLLEYTLLELWKNRSLDGTLTWEAFQHIGGGVEGGLARRADIIFAQKYTPEQQAELRAVLLRLIQPGEGTGDTRRRVSLADLIPAGSSAETVHALLKPLVDERLITTGYDPASDEETVEVSHEALIRAWPTLGAWISTARADLRLHIQLGEAAREWMANSKNPDLLWNGFRLATADAWIERARPQLNERDQRFLDASQAREQAEIEAKEAAQQHELDQARALAAGAVRLRRLAIYLGTALIVTLMVVVLAGWFWYSANRAEQRAFSQYLITKAQVIANDQPLLSVLLALEGLSRSHRDDPGYTELLSTTVELAQRGRIGKISDDGDFIVLSPDRSKFILIHREPIFELCDTTAAACPSTFEGRVREVIFSPDSKHFIVAYDDKPGELRNTDTGEVVILSQELDIPVQYSLEGLIEPVTFSPDSKYFFTRYLGKPEELRHTDNGDVVTLTGFPTYPIIDTKGQRQEPIFTFSPDSKYFFARYGDTAGKLWRTYNGQVVNLPGKANGVTFSPDSKHFIVAYDDKPGELRNTDNEGVVTLTDKLTSARFSPDSKHFFLGYLSKPGELRNTDTGEVVILTHIVLNIGGTFHSGINTKVFSPDSKYVFVRYHDKPSELRRTDTGDVFLVGNINGVTFSPDSKHFTVEYDGKPGELRHTDNPEVITLSGEFFDTTFSPDSKHLFLSYDFQFGELRHTYNKQEEHLVGRVSEGTFSPDSNYFFVRYSDRPDELRGPVIKQRIIASNIKSIDFDKTASHAIELTANGQVYLLDIVWFNTSGSFLDTLPPQEIITRTCKELIRSLRYDEKELEQYLGNRIPEACS